MSRKSDNGGVLLLVDDNPGDRDLIAIVGAECRADLDLRSVNDGLAALQYLRQEDDYADPETSPRPALIIIDLNMPKMGAQEFLKEIGGDPDLRRIPVIVMSTSDCDEDVSRCYDLGCRAFVKKPIDYARLRELMDVLIRHWFGSVILPTHSDRI
jgi:CheY-like chemotaxis protein